MLISLFSVLTPSRRTIHNVPSPLHIHLSVNHTIPNALPQRLIIHLLHISKSTNLFSDINDFLIYNERINHHIIQNFKFHFIYFIYFDLCLWNGYDCALNMF